jgi:hypothetical protein
MDIDKILLRHWINSPEISVNSKWRVDPTYRPGSGTMYITGVRDSIHYSTLKRNEFSEYNLLIKSTGQTEHNEEKFRKLIDEFEENKLEIYKIKINENNIVVDGNHRLSLLTFKNPEIKEIKNIWIERVK